MREFHPKVWAVRWLMAGVVMALLGCQSAPPPTLDARAQKVAALRKLGYTHAADAWELKLGVKLLFESNADEVSEEGRAALAEVAHTLSSVGVDRVIVEGHTDNVPVNNADYPTNWELSAARASTVLRFLIENGGLTASHLVLEGYADTRPVADNATAEGRALNRRADIVIVYPTQAELEAALAAAGGR